MVPEIQSETDKIFCHLGPFFALLPFFALFDSENQNFEKKIKNEKNAWRYYPFMHTCVP